MSEIENIKYFSRNLAVESAKIINSYFRTDINIDIKSDLTPVTIADIKSEEKMRELIMKEFPEHGILGEEFGEYNPDAEFKWILDPIDGTKSFICGVPLFGTLIALTQNGNPIIGAINHPVINEFLIGDNTITKLYHGDDQEGKITRVRDCPDISNAVLLSTDHLDNYKYRTGKNFESLIDKIKLYRTWGDCYGYYLVATGFADIMVDPIMSVWDTMALIPVIRGAGGMITDYYGNDPAAGDSIVACSKILHTTVLKTLNNL
jgi:histidinol phosphatase-like enzyme (inositol monophosphatase family)